MKFQQIGIPRGFYYYSYPGLWEAFFSKIGIEPILSEASSRKTLDLAALYSESEHCLAHKIFDGHLKSLEGRVDTVFIPLVLSFKKKHICCAKFGALPDASKLGVAPFPQVITAKLDENREPLKKTLIRLAKDLGINKVKAKKATEAALAVMSKEKEKRKKEAQDISSKERFLLLGHPYTLEDDLISGPIKRKLTSLGIPLELMTFGEGPKQPSPVRWCTFNSIYHRLLDLDILKYSGVVQLSTFNCGPDSVMIDKYQRICRNRNIPFLLLMLDEHTAFAGIETRLEAFCDSVKWRQKRTLNPVTENHGTQA